MSAGGQGLWSIFHCFPRHICGSWIGSGTTRAWMGANTECQHCRQWLTLPLKIVPNMLMRVWTELHLSTTLCACPKYHSIIGFADHPSCMSLFFKSLNNKIMVKMRNLWWELGHSTLSCYLWCLCHIWLCQILLVWSSSLQTHTGGQPMMVQELEPQEAL